VFYPVSGCSPSPPVEVEEYNHRHDGKTDYQPDPSGKTLGRSRCRSRRRCHFLGWCYFLFLNAGHNSIFAEVRQLYGDGVGHRVNGGFQFDPHTGGFIMSAGSCIDNAKPENLKVMVDFTKEYGVYN